MTKAVLTLKKIVLSFWSCYFSIVTLTNITDGLKAIGVLSNDWKLVSGNFEMILQTTSKLDVPVGLIAFLYCGVIVVELIAAILFWRSVKKTNEANIYIAHSAGLILFGGFIIADEIFCDYTFESIHMRVFFGLLISVIALTILRKTKETNTAD
jgi:hypothetical protein